MVSALVLSTLLTTATPAEWRKVTVDSSAYCTCKKCCGPNAKGVTASGKKAVGKMIAAPKTWKFGTKVRVPGYGECQVWDRGGAIKSKGEVVRNIKIGNKRVKDTRLKYDRIDLLFPSHKEALRWGRKKITIEVWDE